MADNTKHGQKNSSIFGRILCSGETIKRQGGVMQKTSCSTDAVQKLPTPHLHVLINKSSCRFCHTVHVKIQDTISPDFCRPVKIMYKITKYTSFIACYQQHQPPTTIRTFI